MIGIQDVPRKITRNDLIVDLEAFEPTSTEKEFIPKFLELLKCDRCFYRDHFEPGHITGSAILLNLTGDQVLMNYHKSLNKWMNFGGHADGEEDIFAVAIRETMEESGLTTFKPVSASIIDIDIHTIPANPSKGEPKHEHFDIRYIMRMTTADQTPIISDESLQVKWMTFDEALSHLDKGDSLIRFLDKAKNPNNL